MDVNGTAIPSDEITEHLLERVKIQMEDEVHNTHFKENEKQDPVYIIPRGNKPANEYSDPNLLLGIFPTLFPYGNGALEDKFRPV